jgi:hypothetical protein
MTVYTETEQYFFEQQEYLMKSYYEEVDKKNAVSVVKKVFETEESFSDMGVETAEGILINSFGGSTEQAQFTTTSAFKFVAANDRLYEHETETKEAAQLLKAAQLEKAEFEQASTVASTKLQLKTKHAAFFSLEAIASAILVLIILVAMTLFSTPLRACPPGSKSVDSSCDRITGTFASNLIWASSPATFAVFYPDNDAVTGIFSVTMFLHAFLPLPRRFRRCGGTPQWPVSVLIYI